MAPHSSTLAWKIPWMEESGRLQSMGSLESDTTERLRFHFSLSCIGEGNGNPLQCSCLESPRDGRAWWAAISGVAQSQTQLKWLSSSSSNHGPMPTVHCGNSSFQNHPFQNTPALRTMLGGQPGSRHWPLRCHLSHPTQAIQGWEGQRVSQTEFKILALTAVWPQAICLTVLSILHL